MDNKLMGLVASVLWDFPVGGEEPPHTVEGLCGVEAVRIDCDIRFYPGIFDSSAPKDVFEELTAAKFLEIGVRRRSDPKAPCFSMVLRCTELGKDSGNYLFAVRSRVLVGAQEIWYCRLMCGMPTIQNLWRAIPRVFHAQVDAFIHDFLNANDPCYWYN